MRPWHPATAGSALTMNLPSVGALMPLQGSQSHPFAFCNDIFCSGRRQQACFLCPLCLAPSPSPFPVLPREAFARVKGSVGPGWNLRRRGRNGRGDQGTPKQGLERIGFPSARTLAPAHIGKQASLTHDSGQLSYHILRGSGRSEEGAGG